MQLVFLGTSAGSPTRERNVAALAVRRDGGWDLFDCGEGTQHRLADASLALPRLRRIFISHLHGDHCFGLFGLLASRSVHPDVGPLDVYGPRGLEEMVRVVLEQSSTHLGYELRVHEVPDNGRQLVADDVETVDAVPLDHRVTSFGWLIREAERRGEFDVARAEELGVRRGRAFGRLQHGEAVTLPDGRTVEPHEVLGPPRPGRSVIIAGDNRDPARLLAASGSVQLLVHEATFTEDVVAEIGDDLGHSTAARVGEAARAAGVPNLVLTHFSPRYQTAERDGHSIDDIRREAGAHYDGNLHLAADWSTFELSPDGVLKAGSGS